MFKCVRAIGYVPYWCHYLTFIGRGDGRRYSRKAKPTEPLTQSEAAFQIFEQEAWNIWILRKPRDSFQLCLWRQSWHLKPENICFLTPPKNLTFGRTQSKRASSTSSSHATPSPEYVQSVSPRLLSALSGVVLSYRRWETNISRRLLIVQNELEMNLVSSELMELLLAAFYNSAAGRKCSQSLLWPLKDAPSSR